MDDFDSLDFDEPLDPDTHLEIMMSIAVRIMLRHQHDPQAFIQEAQKIFPFWITRILPPQQQMSPQKLNGLAILLARQWWNHTPLPDHHFKPQPLPALERNMPCVCGSGQKFKHCCAQLPPLSFPTEVFGGLVMKNLNKKILQQYSKMAKLPIKSLSQYAEQQMEEGRFSDVLTILKPYVNEHADLLKGKAGAFIFDQYCEASTHTHNTNRTKLAVIENLKNHHDKIVRSAAWQRLATIEIDEGNSEAAWHAFQQAQRASPDDPTVAMLEITLLGQQEDWAHVKQRAQFWLRRFKQLKQIDDSPILDFMRACAENPQQVLQNITFETQASELGLLTALLEQAPPPQATLYHVEKIHDEKGKQQCILVPHKNLKKIEQAWQHIFTIGKPFSVHAYPEVDLTPWQNVEWLYFLEKNPASFNSIDILDDVLSVFLMHPNAEYRWVREPVVILIAERVLALVHVLLQPDAQLPWMASENRPWLRTIARAGYEAQGTNQTQTMMNCFYILLMLNPNDNHGVRDTVINELLKTGKEEEALEIIERYPEDVLAGVRYGGVLAQWRQQQYEQAEQTFLSAWKSLPKVAQALLKNNMPKPTLDENGFKYGGDDQAWLYRDEMRDEWLRSEGALDWLAAQVKKTSKKR